MPSPVEAFPCGIEVDHQHALPDRGQRGGEVDRGGGLADAALLVGDRDDAGPSLGRAVACHAMRSVPAKRSTMRIRAAGSVALGASRAEICHAAADSVNSPRQRAPLGEQADRRVVGAERGERGGVFEQARQGREGAGGHDVDRPGVEVLDARAADLAGRAGHADGLGEEGGLGGVGFHHAPSPPRSGSPAPAPAARRPSRDRRCAAPPPAGAPRAGPSPGCDAARCPKPCRARSGCGADCQRFSSAT